MNEMQANAFYAAAGFHGSAFSFDCKLLVGGLMIIGALCIMNGLLHLLNSPAPWEKSMFLINLFVLAFLLMLVFIYVA